MPDKKKNLKTIPPVQQPMYRVISLYRGKPAEEQALLNQAVSEGWRLVNVLERNYTGWPHHAVFYFERAEHKSPYEQMGQSEVTFMRPSSLGKSGVKYLADLFKPEVEISDSEGLAMMVKGASLILNKKRSIASSSKLEEAAKYVIGVYRKITS